MLGGVRFFTWSFGLKPLWRKAKQWMDVLQAENRLLLRAVGGEQARTGVRSKR